MSTTSNRPDIEVRTRTVHIAGYPDTEYEVTLVKPAGRGADSWALVEVTVRSIAGAPITDLDFPFTADLRSEALQGLDLAELDSPRAAMRDLAWLPLRCQRSLYHRGITTNAELFALSEKELRQVRGFSPRVIELVDATRADQQGPKSGKRPAKAPGKTS